jgi:isocitrate dehydrogenase
LAGQNRANPSGLLQGAIMMLNHIGQSGVAEKIQNAWLTTIEQGLHTNDIYKEGVSLQKLGTKEFAQAVINNLGKTPHSFKPVSYEKEHALQLPAYKRKPAAKKELKGVDVFVHWSGTNPATLASIMQQMETDTIKLTMITNRGIKVWPEGFEETFCTDHWRCRYKPVDGKSIFPEHIIQLLSSAIANNIDTIKTENLYSFNNIDAFSLGQGQ